LFSSELVGPVEAGLLKAKAPKAGDEWLPNTRLKSKSESLSYGLVVLWHVHVEYDSKLSNPSLGGAAVQEATYGPITLDFDINDKLRVEPGSTVGAYSYLMTETTGKPGDPWYSKITSSGSAETAPAAGVQFGRWIQLCDPDLEVKDPDTPSAPNRVYLLVTVSFPVTTTVEAPDVPPTQKEDDAGVGLPSASDAFNQDGLAYDFSQTVNKDSIHPPPPQVWTAEANNFNYKITTSNLSLEYSVPKGADGSYADNLLNPAVTRLGGYKEVKQSRNLASDGNGWSIHGNNQIRVLVDGVDASSSFNTRRYYRSWTSPLASNKPAPENTDSGSFSGVPWQGDTEGAGASWIDIPGEQTPLRPASWPAERFLEEFVVMVQNFPEFGLLYFNVVCDTLPNYYRVRMNAAIQITPDEWCALKGQDAPFQKPADGNAIFDSNWQGAT
jgi:hypothetical protein